MFIDTIEWFYIVSAMFVAYVIGGLTIGGLMMFLMTRKRILKVYLKKISKISGEIAEELLEEEDE